MSELTSGQMNQLRTVELSILNEFIRVCDELDLKYFIVQGTLLGAVRHKGFIPWDDDIDVGMLRKDYEVFIKNAQQLLPENIFLQTHETDQGYMHCFAKLRNSNTAFVELSSKNINMNHGIYIDIFPFDYYPDKILPRIMYDLRKLMIRYRERENYYIPSDYEPSIANFFRWTLKKISRLLYPTIEIAIEKQEQMYKSVTDSKKFINNGSPWGKREIVPREWMLKTVNMHFENLTVMAPQGYDAYLRNVYGDYMQLPPEEKRVSHHYLYKLDFDHSYRTYMAERKDSSGAGW